MVGIIYQALIFTFGTLDLILFGFLLIRLIVWQLNQVDRLSEESYQKEISQLAH